MPRDLPGHGDRERSAVVLAQDTTTVCGEDPGWVCSTVLERTGNDFLAVNAERLVLIPLVLIGAFVVHRAVRRAIDRFVRRMERQVRRRVERGRDHDSAAARARNETRRLQRLQAVGGAVRGAAGVVVWLTAILLIVSQFVSLGPVLAGAGLAGLVVGFGAQNLIRDFLAGISMLVEDQYGVGDWITVEGRSGAVEEVGLRTTRIRDVDGVVWHIPNGHVQLLGNLSQRWARATLDVPVALDTDVARARRTIQRVADRLAADPEWGLDIIGPPEIWGVQDWGPQGITIRLVIPTRPLRNWDVLRQTRERLKLAFEREGIRLPAPMLEVGAQRTGEPVRLSSGATRPEPSERRRPSLPPDTTGRIPTVLPLPDDEADGAPPDVHP